MLMVAPNEGKLLLLAWLLKVDPTTAFPLKLALFINDITPDDDTVLADFDPATFDDSDPIDIARSEFSTPAIVSNVAYTTRTPVPSWTCTSGGPETAYGWFLYDAAAGKCVLTQRFDSPRVMDTGATESLDPYRIGLKTLA